MSKVQPCKIIQREMLAREMNIADLAIAMRTPVNATRCLVEGYIPICTFYAKRLETAFDIKEAFWLNLERNYTGKTNADLHL